jgi:hypothetical protein
VPGNREGGKAFEGRGWVQREAHEFGKESNRTAQNKNKEITKSDPICISTTRWRFTAITPDSFHWLGEALQPDGQTWKLEGEFRGKRI